jgi:hypothetical protein
MIGDIVRKREDVGSHKIQTLSVDRRILTIAAFVQGIFVVEFD